LSYQKFDTFFIFFAKRDKTIPSLLIKFTPLNFF